MAKPYELYLYEEIGDFGTNASGFIAGIKAAGKQPIELRINSPGGSVFDGYAIFNALKRHEPGVTVFVDGLAASIASYIAMAGNMVFMADNAMLMIHLPYSGGGGTADEMRKDAAVLDKITNSLVDAYVSRTGIPDTEIRKMLDEETWMDAKQALAFGFVDGITEPLEMAAKFDAKALSKFKNVPADLKERFNKESRKAGKESNMQSDISADPAMADLLQEVAESAPQPSNIEPQTSEAKPSIFSRVASMLKDKNEFLAEITDLKATISAQSETIDTYSAKVEELERVLAEAQTDVAQYQANEKTLEEAIARHEAEAKTATDRAVDIVAAAGFPQDKLPAVQGADSVKSAQQLLDEYNAITDPAEQTRFFKANKEAIAAANAELKAAKK